jgi:hypothetical protein
MSQTHCQIWWFIVQWQSWCEFINVVEVNNGVELAVVTLTGDQYACILKVPNGTYHLILTVGSNVSIIIEESRRLSRNVPVLVLSGTAHRAFQTVFNNAEHILGG